MKPHIHLIGHPLSALDEELSRRLHWKRHPRARAYESLSDWADREVKIACKKEDGYGTGCYKSALKAFHSLMDDGHSGCSIGFTQAILNRLIEGKPLTPIDDDPALWNECGWRSSDGATIYQNSRMSGLFKDAHPDGTITFSDIDRVILIEVEDDGTETTWHSGLASKLVDEIVGPITLPYCPKEKPYKVYAKQFDSVNAEVGSFDTSHIIKIVDPDGNEIPCERFYKETTDGEEEIGRDEYLRREQSYYAKLAEGGKK